ncbi:MAG: 2-dehydropantoate 2-reductase [Armatimonadota bacterium]|nr:2-dehydropantoate 2-reductase [Armatimonadota bacterium]MDR7486111.1 2-dehydropantoate 2-reductase [Armatimonadota bacterium]MDR7531742.1 2-dehydropantoate 2-reductase [Armatimonadota bacterium]MDR7534914.1 2-dehydropantoate 2-reductase [Armatimonadota bacterium]
MDLTIVGAGAVGGITGAHLARAGHSVVLVDRNRAHIEAMRTRGLEVAGAAAFTVRLHACLPEEVRGPLAVVLLAVKTLHTRDALAPLVPRLAPDGYVVSMQNGLEEEKIAALVGRERTVGAFLTFGGYYERPGRVVYSGPGSLRVGELDGRLTPRVRELARVLSAFHPCEPTENIHGYLWGKLILGAIYFATAVVDADVLEILDRPQARAILAGLATEALAVAEALGVRVEPVDGFDPRAIRLDPRGAPVDPAGARAAWAAQRAYWQRGLARRTGVWRDLAVHRRPSEAGPILGALVEAAGRAGRPVPRVRALLRLIADIEAGRGVLDWTNLEVLAAAA